MQNRLISPVPRSHNWRASLTFLYLALIRGLRTLISLLSLFFQCPKPSRVSRHIDYQVSDNTEESCTAQRYHWLIEPNLEKRTSPDSIHEEE